MKKVVMFSVLIFLLFGCGEEEIWQPISDQDKEQELLQFMESYKDTWEESLEGQTYSLMETHFVPNTHVYHMERKQHQDLIAERRIESFVGFSNVIVEESEYDDEYRVQWTETIAIEKIGSSEEETRLRQYYISEGSSGYRITAIETLEE
ncbi:TcaA NTF2-like domain-containing protein [Salipaludibacillus sp. CF4.18]|uniref:TcaA NTF2-like domain-containing protein n=1 Tax=Salipaludibacillus sp. CF4.18 TaxID=3373081 RepID=UPI003EE78D01